MTANRPARPVRALARQPRFLIAQIAHAYSGLQAYDCIAGRMRVHCTTISGSSGQLGAIESVSYQSGERVLIMVFPDYAYGFILGRAETRSLAMDYSPPCGVLVPEQAEGYIPGDDQSWVGDAATRNSALRNNNSGLLDTLPGDWHVTNRNGAVIGVEGWRAFLQAGHAAGLWAYSDDGLVKLFGSRILIEAVGQKQEIGVDGSGVSRNERFLNVDDQFSNKNPTAIELAGEAVGGFQQYISYREGLNGSGTNGAGRIALLHEYRGLDGSYALTSAASITLQKYINLPMPDKPVAEPAPTDPDGEPDDCKLFPAEAEEDEEEDETPPAAGGVSVQSFGSRNPLSFAMNARGVVDKLTYRQAIFPARAAAGAVETPRPEVCGVQSYRVDSRMWKTIPGRCGISLKFGAGCKTYYAGRALFSITEDGSIVLEEAGGAQIMLSGGNIYLNAPHDIIQCAGRNIVDIAGRDAVVRASRHLDLLANEGRMTASAAASVTIVGGTAGQGGVMIESRGEGAEVADSGENPGTTGSVVIRARHAIAMDSTLMSLKVKGKDGGWSADKADQSGEGKIVLDTQHGIDWRATIPRRTGHIGRSLSISETDSDSNQTGIGVVINPTQTSIFTSGLAVRNLFFKARYFWGTSDSFAAITTSASNNWSCWATQSMLWKYIDDQMTSTITPTGMSFENLKSKYLDAKAYGTDRPTFFALPRPNWQARLNELVNAAGDDAPAEADLMQGASIQDNPLNDSNAFPGKGSWDGSSMLTSDYNSPEWLADPALSFQTTIAGSALEGGLGKSV